jgi:signal transduction histidine kinase
MPLPPLRKYWLEAAWLVFASLNAAAIVFVGVGETVPFHFIFLSFTLLYCLRPWPLPQTIVFTLLNALISGVPLYFAVRHGPQGVDELAEVPLMTTMFVVMVWHVRRRQEAMDELRRSAERERGFIREASHLLRTPITVARGHAELISFGLNGGNGGSDMKIVLDELNRLSRISSRLLLMAKADEQRSFFPSDVDLDELAGVLLRRWSAIAPRRWEAHGLARGTVVADAEKITLAVDELIENAIKCTDQGDRISITTRAEGGTAVIEVADTGRGVCPGDRARIFERFTRVDPVTNGHDGGVGLGLSIVRSIAEAHGGTVQVESSPGSGATFSMRLPRFTRELPAPRSSPASVTVLSGS